jgi:hypothetical protein
MSSTTRSGVPVLGGVAEERADARDQCMEGARGYAAPAIRRSAR